MKYTGINIGPIVSTISMGRKPREIWAASYMFSYLMECIIAEIKKNVGIEIISPAVLTNTNDLGVGLYPDRVFVKGEFEPGEMINKALENFEEVTGINPSYVNVMYLSKGGKELKSDVESIKELNRLLDCTELYNHPVDSKVRQDVLNLIKKKKGSSLIKLGFGDENFSVPYLAELATRRLDNLNKEEWNNLCDKFRDKDSNNDGNEDEFYTGLIKLFRNNKFGNEHYYSFYKYICIVQADGDNMGKIVSTIPANRVKEVSEELLEYGKKANEVIKDYGGLPIYAGGDDLLFIAPVKSGSETIFDLIDKIDEAYKEMVDKSIESFRPRHESNLIHTYLSYGLSISYYKYPLYEAFKNALTQLFDRAKKVNGKNAVAWCLRKHSGSGFVSSLSKGGGIYSKYKKIMDCSVEEKVISAIAHKLKNNENLLGLLLDGYRKTKEKNELKSRLANFYQKTMEDIGNSDYVTASRELLFELMIDTDNLTGIDEILENMYGMLRTAKFINGEGDKDE